MDDIYKILKLNILSSSKTYLTLTDFYSFIECYNKFLRNSLDFTEGYLNFVDAVEKLINEQIITSIKNSRFNGKTPALPLKFKLLKPKTDYEKTKQEIIALNNPINVEFYLNHPDIYLEDRKYILIFNNFLDLKCDEFISINERSFELFGHEKFLKGTEKVSIGETIMKRLGLSYNDLKCYYSYEPFFGITFDSYYKKDKRRIAIIENKDTFWTLKKLISEEVFFLDIDMIIYGQGKKIISSFQFIEEFSPQENDVFVYYGDIDPEGINIFENLIESYLCYKIIPFAKMYTLLVDVSDGKDLPSFKQGQNINKDYISAFLKNFEEIYRLKILELLSKGKYIPQEALSYSYLKDYFLRSGAVGT